MYLGPQVQKSSISLVGAAKFTHRKRVDAEPPQRRAFYTWPKAIIQKVMKVEDALGLMMGRMTSGSVDDSKCGRPSHTVLTISTRVCDSIFFGVP